MNGESTNELQHKSKVDSESYITIQGWMLTNLKLSGNDLLVYAIIYGFSKDGKSEFYGGRQYLADWCNSTVRGIQKNIDNLEKLGLIIQTSNVAGVGVKYKAIKKDSIDLNISSEQSSRVPVNKVPTTSEQSSHNNTDNTIKLKDNTILKNSTAEPFLEEISLETEKPKRRLHINDDFDSKSYDTAKEEKKQTKRLNLFDKCIAEIDNYTEDDKLRTALKNYLSVRLKMKDKPIYGVNQWKGMLSTLSTLSGDKVAIVEKATERGWGGFFELKDFQYKNYNSKPDRSIFGESPEMTSLLPNEVEGGESSGIIF